MDFLLKIKNWQLFLLILLFPCIFTFGFMVINNNAGKELIFSVLRNSYYLIIISWSYKVIKTFNNTSSIHSEKQIKLLDWFIVISFMWIIFTFLPKDLNASNFLIIKLLKRIIFLAFPFTFIYLVFFTAKLLTHLRLGNQVKTGTIIFEMIKIFYLPISLWWLQKEVNGYYSKK